MTGAPGPAAEVVDVETPHGPGRLHLDHPVDGEARAVLLLGHGAGGGVDARDLAALAAHLPMLPGLGVTVARFEQPWRVAGRTVASPPATLDAGLRAAVLAVRARLTGVPLVLGGRSAGARSAARCAAELDAAGCVLLAFPLHPPGRPERSRAAELLGCTSAGRPTLVLQGERDAFGRPEELPPLAPPHRVVALPGADHGLAVGKRAVPDQAAVLALVGERTAAFLRDLLA